MEDKTFRAMIVREREPSEFVREIGEKPLADLPEGEVLIRVAYSSLNYKDALSASGHKGVTRRYPHTPGIDAAGRVEESRSADFRPGDEVIVTGYDLGMNTSGGWGEFIRVPAEWPVHLPDGLSLKESMIYGTAGFTAALAVHRLMEYGLTPAMGDIVVTGATGGLGSLAIATLARAGYRAVAATRKLDRQDFLLDLGAVEVVSSEELAQAKDRVLLKERWAGGIDAVGGDILSALIRATQYGGAVASCGNAASHELSLTVYPFILRAVSLLGIDSVNCPAPVRKEIWYRIANQWKLENPQRIASTVTLDELDEHIERILRGEETGRVVVDLQR